MGLHGAETQGLFKARGQDSLSDVCVGTRHGTVHWEVRGEQRRSCSSDVPYGQFQESPWCSLKMLASADSLQHE